VWRQPRDRVAVIGIGGLGHLAVKFLRAWGCEVTAFTTSPSKREEALAIGAYRVLDTRNDEELVKIANGFDFTAAARPGIASCSRTIFRATVPDRAP